MYISKMATYSTREAAQKLGLSMATINRYISTRQLPVPPVSRVGGVRVRLWSDLDIEKARAILRTFGNGRRDRHRKKRQPTKK
jgi:predicted DNA-binding transcriptional regulator AlpA